MGYGMPPQRKIRLIEPQGRPARPLNAYIRRFPLVGPILLATILDERGYDVSVYNENVSGPVDADRGSYEDVCGADVVGISIMTPTAARGYAIADRLRRDAPAATIVFGGVHATFMPEEALAHGDVVVLGEGETVIEAIASGEITSGVLTPSPADDLDALPTLNHFLMRDFQKLIDERPRREMYELPVMTSRGCPYACTYCSVTKMFGRKVRRQSVEKVHADLRRHVQQGFRSFFFYDDNFTSDRDWTKDLLERLRPMRIRFNAQSRVDFHWVNRARHHSDKALLKAMRRGGCNALMMGYETLEDGTAKHWHKGYQGNHSLEARLEEDTAILHDHGIWTYAMFVLGPQHGPAAVERIVDFAQRCHVGSMQISVLTPFPGTPLMDEMRPHLVLNRFPADWDYYDATHCVYDHGRMDVEVLQSTLLKAYHRFYRWGGWNRRSLRHIVGGPGTFSDKLGDLWGRVQLNRNMLARWQTEMDDFASMIRTRTGR